MQPAANVNNGKGGNEDQIVVVVTVDGERRARYSDISLRVLGMAVTLVAAVLIGVSKETKVISFTINANFPPLHILVIAKWKYMSALVYFFIANAIACSYSAISLIAVSMMPKGQSKQPAELSLLLITLDSAIVSLLFSANGAALAVGLLGRDGNEQVHWIKVCYMFDRFCNQMSVSFCFSLIGCLSFFLLIVISALKLHKKL